MDCSLENPHPYVYANLAMTLDPPENLQGHHSSEAILQQVRGYWGKIEIGRYINTRGEHNAFYENEDRFSKRRYRFCFFFPLLITELLLGERW